MASQLSDEDIIHAVQTRADGVEWLTGYINRYWKMPSTKVLRSEGASDDEAHYVFKEAISALYYKIAENAFKGDSALETYFIGICKNKLAKKIRENIRDRKQNQDPVEEAIDGNHPHSEMEQRQLPEVIEECLSEIGEPCRTIERLKLEGWGLEAIAEHLSMTLRQVKGKSAECREKLIERLKKYGYGRPKK